MHVLVPARARASPRPGEPPPVAPAAGRRGPRRSAAALWPAPAAPLRPAPAAPRRRRRVRLAAACPSLLLRPPRTRPAAPLRRPQARPAAVRRPVRVRLATARRPRAPHRASTPLARSSPSDERPPHHRSARVAVAVGAVAGRVTGGDPGTLVFGGLVALAVLVSSFIPTARRAAPPNVARPAGAPEGRPARRRPIAPPPTRGRWDEAPRAGPLTRDVQQGASDPRVAPQSHRANMVLRDSHAV